MAEKVITEIGERLDQTSFPHKGFLVKSLRKAATALSELDQNPLLEPAIKPLSDYVLKRDMLEHKDRDVRLLLATCFTEIIRVLAPEPPFTDNDFREIFKFIISMFSELADPSCPYFSRTVRILETVSKLKCCLIMLDIGCEDLVLEMFNTFFFVVRELHQQSFVDAILSIMELILKEKVSQTLLDVIFSYLLKEGKGISTSASSRLAASVIQACSEKLEPFVWGFLTSCMLDRDAVKSKFKEVYHDIIFNVYQCTPQMLLGVIPNLTQEFRADQVDIRKKVVNLIGRLLALPEHHFAQEYHCLFIEFLKSFSDESAEVRVSALQCAKACYTANPSGTESDEVLSALYGRLIDFDESVRAQAIIVACDLSISNFNFVPPKLISETSERLWDIKISVRKKALQKLLEVYREYCTKCREGYMTFSDDYEQIPCRILMLYYDKECKEFRSQNMELVLADDLFPVSLSVEERTRHWIYLFSLFDTLHVKALNSILGQKRRFQTEFQIYLALRRKEKESTSEEVHKRVKTSFMKMSNFFPDPVKAEVCFYKLNQMKDNIFKTLLQLLNEVTITNAVITRDKFLQRIGDRHPNFEFLQLLSTKCVFNIFSSEHVGYIVDYLYFNGYGEQHLKASVHLLLVIISTFPSLLKDSETQFQSLLLEDNPFNEKLIQVLAKAGAHVSIKLCDIYPFLERVCLKGTRSQSKFAISAMAALTTVSEQFNFSGLFKELVDSLHNAQNVPTVLQSLGCIGQHSVYTFESRDKEITKYIQEKIFQVKQSDDLASFNRTSEPCDTCKLKIYGIKTLVKSFLPHQGTCIRRQIHELLDLLSKMLQTSDIKDNCFSCESDSDYMRLGAAKSVLRLSRRWDLNISAEIFRLTVLMAKDSSFSGRKLFLDKTYKLLKEHVIPSRYACAFAFAAPDYFSDLEYDPCIYMAEFIKEYSREAQICQSSAMHGRSIAYYPAYIVVFLIHVLAYETGFPAENCKDEEVYARFCSPLFFVILALANASIVGGDNALVKDATSHLLSIFHAIKNAEDAVDVQRTSKLHILADIGISTMNVLNHCGISSSHVHSRILLPSSIYRANSECPAKSTFDEAFLKKIIHKFSSNISLLTSSVPKRGRKGEEGSSWSDVIMYGILNLASRMQVDLLTSGTNEDKSLHTRGKEAANFSRQEIVTRVGKKRAVSPTDPGSIKLRRDSSRANGFKNDVVGDPEIFLRFCYH